MREPKTWTVTITLVEDEESTDATAHLLVGETTYGGWGRARRNPIDPDMPRVGDELAVARSLSDMAHKLLDDAARRIEEVEGRPVRLHE
ncbi:MAG: DUF1876 domain-containing protein [Acidimicrobiales bacterium]|nr:DUF1876 domain-containing protein [Acidimicrobiales bacterium]